jgi:hypothetical protein
VQRFELAFSNKSIRHLVKMAKLSTVLLVVFLSFSFTAASFTVDKKDGDDYDFFDIFLDLFGFGSSEEQSYDNKNITSEF